MTLLLKTKAVRFEWSDGDVESVVTLSSDDDPETLVRKLKRVIALVEGGQAPNVSPLPPAAEAVIKKAYEPSVAALATGNGWAAVYGPPKPPEHWEGQVEIVKPGEDA
jgi:hypothetical protein